MNIPSSEESTRQAEWQAQESAMQAERRAGDSTNDDQRVQRYRVLARVLRQPLPEGLPEDFARSVAHRAQADAVPLSQLGQVDAIPVSQSMQVDATSLSQPVTVVALDPLESGFERNLLRALAALFGIGIGAIIALFAGPWLKLTLDAVWPFVATLKNAWLLTFVGCVVVSTLLQHWRRELH